MIIPFENLESIPEYQDHNTDYCRYLTSDDNRTPSILEITDWPNIFDYLHNPTVKYRAYYKIVDDENFELDYKSIPGVVSWYMNGEPVYNEINGVLDYSKPLYGVFIDFDDLGLAYNYAINKILD
jgi:hypothetical protein